jgi:hypothetical protein
MPMDSVSEENVKRLLNDRDDKEKELITLQSTTIENMWLNELDELKKMLSNVSMATKPIPKENTASKITKIKKTSKKITIK